MNKKILIWLGLVVFLLVLLWSGASFYPDWLWFKNLGYSPVFWTLLLSKFGLGSVVWLVFIAIMILNLIIANRLKPSGAAATSIKYEGGTLFQLSLSGKTVNLIIIGFFLIASFLIASKGAYRWDTVLLYFNQEPFGSTDPIFNKDIGFFIFSLPFYIFLQKGLLTFFFIAGLVMVWWYLKDAIMKIIDEFSQAEGKPPVLTKFVIEPNARKHLLFLCAIIFILLAWGYYLKVFNLLYSTAGAAFGAGYTDVNVRILAYRILIFASLGLAAVFFLDIFKPRKKLIWISIGVWLVVALLFWNLLPLAVQKFLVKPNELAKESPYISYNIDYTRKAYDLNKIEEVDFPVNEKLSKEDLKKHNATIQNIKIWDERPLLQTYRQIQSIRLYYDFNNVDVDRYFINNQYRQVMLAGRELATNQLPPQARTWVNRHLIYTHGYGITLSPVNEVTGEGFPRLMIKDLPPAFETDLTVKHPEIYYGEKTNEYVLVKTKTKEFDYPKGDKNVYSIYQGKGGVHIKSFLRRILFAFEFLDPQILFTNYLGPESRVMYNRRIDWRVRAIAPFLQYDGDPYLVVSDGRLYWIQDAFTTSNMYPYSRRSYKRFNKKALNYIRNSVKVTIDAYNGDVSFYKMGVKDPIVKAYGNIFPDLFKPLDQMPTDLKKHIRYPMDLFAIQVDAYRTYHMDNVQVFYNQEDLWQIPDELYGDNRQQMKPYYIILKLPEMNKEEFILMLPFTPSKRDNMIGWIAARSDLPNYGHLLVYKLPKEKLIYGPMQIEARIDQQTDISRELSLWGQRGSRVIRGNLLAIPVGDSFIYVEPVYLEAKQEESKQSPSTRPQQKVPGKSKGSGPQVSRVPDRTRAAALPELKRVIVAFSNRIAMENDLNTALYKILGETIPHEETTPIVEVPASVTNRIEGDALEQYRKAKDLLRQGKWAEFGKALEDLESILKKMSAEVNKTE